MPGIVKMVEKGADSKQLTDKYISDIVEKVIDSIDYSLLILNNEKYNEQIKLHNLNQIKALMHNKAYLNLKKKVNKLPQLLVVDDFCGEEKYYQYLKNEQEVVGNITFKTKAESQYLAVALASMIARYGFIKHNIMNSLKEQRVDNSFHMINKENDLYSMVRIEDINKFNKKLRLKRIKIISSDGASDYIRTSLNQMSDDEFKIFLNYHFKVCERKDLLGASSHLLDIIKKND